MPIPSTLSNVIVEGNTIDAGNEFTYNYMVVSTSDCRISGNYFSGIKSDSSASIMLFLSNSTNNIYGNTFVRGSSSINAYIVNVGSDDQIITNNIFDSTTTDGSSTILVSNLTATSLYTNNKNQTGYSIIPLGTNKPAVTHAHNGSSTPFGIYNSSDFTSISTSYGVTSGAFYDDYVLEIFETSSSPTDNYFAEGVDISAHIPPGAKIIDAKISVFNPSSVALDTGTTNQFNLALSAGRNHTNSIDTKTYQSAGALSWMLGFNILSTLTITSGNESNMHSAYQVIDIPTTNFTGIQTDATGTTTSVTNVDVSSNYVAGNDYGLTAKLLFNFKASSAGSFSPYIPLIVVSPLIITYQW